MKFTKLIFFILLIVFVSSCSDDECRTETDVHLYASLSIKADSIWVKATDSDSILYNNKKSVQTTQIPLKKFGSESVFIYRINTLSDTIHIYHSNYDYLIDYSCGCQVFHTIDSIRHTNHQIEKIEIINSSVTNANEENIKIYF